MADYQTRTRSYIRHEWFLPNPTNAVEFGKALANAEQFATQQGIILYDDTIKITATEDEITLYIQGDIVAA